jgi:hypothetical protein
MFGQCGILEMFGQCGILEMFGQCGILEMFGQCGILEMFGQCGILEMVGQCVFSNLRLQDTALSFLRTKKVLLWLKRKNGFVIKYLAEDV